MVQGSDSQGTSAVISLQLFLVWQIGQRWTWAMVKQSQ